MLEKRSDGGEKSPVVEKSEPQEKDSSIRVPKEGSADDGLVSKENVKPPFSAGRPTHLL